jgi:ribosomal protein S18 acetylase RimI-like enzyme
VVLIRSGTPADAAGIVAVRRASWPAAYAGILPPEVIEAVVARATVAGEQAGFAEQPWRRLLVAETEPAPARDRAVAPVAVITGYASYGIEQGPNGLPRSPLAGGPAGGRPLAAELYTLYVAPDHWSTGAGRALMDRVLTEVRAEGYPRIILWVLRDNRRARRFYERAGFRRKGAEHPSFFAGVPEVRYVRALLPAALPAACYQPRARHSPRCGRSAPSVVSAPCPG